MKAYYLRCYVFHNLYVIKSKFPKKERLTKVQGVHRSDHANLTKYSNSIHACVYGILRISTYLGADILVIKGITNVFFCCHFSISKIDINSFVILEWKLFFKYSKMVDRVWRKGVLSVILMNE